MDQRIDLKPDFLDNDIKALSFRKMPGYISGMANPRDNKELYDLMQRCTVQRDGSGQN
jgi:hypothetical protein